MQTVSVVVPIYNQARYLRACLDSIWFQQYPSIEIIIVNDGSTDATAERIEAFLKGVQEEKISYASYYNANDNTIERTSQARYPSKGRSIKVFNHKMNLGLASALNTGFSACSGVYCTYVPSDDICYPHMFSELAAALDEGADFAYADMLIVNDVGEVQRLFSLPTYSFKNCFEDWYLCGVAKLYRTKLHNDFGYYNEDLLAHDHGLFQHFAMQGARFVHVPKPLMGVLSHDGEREVDIHSPTNWNRLLEESKKLVLEARSFMKGKSVV